MSEHVEADMNCTEKNGKVLCKIQVVENGKKAECTLGVEELQRGVSANLSCTGDKELFEKMQNREYFWNVDGKDIRLKNGNFKVTDV